jgi:hypothetical protein
MHLGIADRGRLDAAIEQFKRAVYSGYPTYITYSMLAEAEAAKGNDAAAKSVLAEARRLFPQLIERSDAPLLELSGADGYAASAIPQRGNTIGRFPLMLSAYQRKERGNG